MLSNIFMKTNRDRVIAMLVGASVLGFFLPWGMAVYKDIDLSFYNDLPEVFRSLMGIPEGADAATMTYGAMYSFMGSMTLAALAISMGAASIAGEERSGTIGILLGNPVGRSRVLAAKAASLVVLSAIGVAILWLFGAVTPVLLDVETGSLHLAAFMLHLFVNTLFYGFLALAVGAWTGNGSAASGVPVAIMVVGYLAVGIVPLIDAAAGWERVFPWYYFDSAQPSVNGVEWAHVGILGGAAAVFAALGFVGVNRRDLKTRSTRQTIVDRLRNDPRTAKIVERIAGSARVSGLFSKTVSDHQGLLITVVYIMAIMGLMMGPLYGFIPEEAYEAFDQFPDALLAMIGGGNMGTPAGFFQAEIFSITAPIALAVLTVVLGARAMAGEEKNHTMGLLLANPIPRSRIVIEKAAVMVLYAGIAAVVTFAATWIGVLLGGLELPVGNLIAASVLVWLLSLVLGGVALAVGAFTGRTAIASYAASGLGLVWYFLWSFGSLSESTERLAGLSVFHYYLGGDPLNNGMDWGGAAVLVAAFLILVAGSVWAFERRDLRG